MIIGFSGASHSGKSTVMRALIEKNKDFVLIEEPIRKMIKDINELRKNPSMNLEIQEEIFKNRLSNIFEAKKHTIYLSDRTLVDCFFYFTNYINHTQLSESLKKDYFNLLHKFIDALNAYDKLYDLTCLFKSIKPTEEQELIRDYDLEMIQEHEEFSIISLTKSISNKIMIFDLNTTSKEEVVSLIEIYVMKLQYSGMIG